MITVKLTDEYTKEHDIARQKHQDRLKAIADKNYEHTTDNALHPLYYKENREAGEEILYAICYNRRVGLNTWIPETMYIKALSQGDARLKFFRSESPVTMLQQFDVIAIAPVIGYNVNDKLGNKVSV